MSSLFSRFIGIDYSGARTADDSLAGLRVYLSGDEGEPEEVRPQLGKSRHWSRREIAHWLAVELSCGPPTLVGVDHAFSFPHEYFERHQLPLDWAAFLFDFCRHWPTSVEGVTVEDVRRGRCGRGASRAGESRWRRTAERRCKSAKSVFHFDVPGSVAKSTHAALPWLAFLRSTLGSHLHCWPFDGWQPPEGLHVIAEVYPTLWRARYPCNDRTPDQQDAYATVLGLQEASRVGELPGLFAPDLPCGVRETARYEGWILGVR